MLTTKRRRSTIRTLRGWAIHVLQEAGAIRECEEHGWMQDRADSHPRERAFDIARRDPPAGVSTDEAVAEVRDVLDSIGDIRGDPDTMRELAKRRPAKFGMVVVQPGITKGGLEPRLAEVLAAANYHLVRAGHAELEVWGSA